ncbi:MAG: UvrD-helicase domain-containing protein [Sedimentisphaerales bacterium]|nr:UvrD-helicase domain-containing protein [Sedimentisphaerales bacterium]
MNNTSKTELTVSQSQAVHHKDGPLLVLAGPGSGKTRVITYRIASLIESGVRPYNICAITFTNKAAEEMRQRAILLGSSAGAQISTFHSLCVRILRQYAAQAGIKPGFTVYDDSDQSKCVKEAVKKCELDTTSFAPARMLDAISTLKNKLIDPESFKGQAGDFFSSKLSKVYSNYQKLLGEHNGLDFDDLLMKVAFLLRDYPDVREQLNNRYKYLLIDEYQDTNHAQYTIAKYLAVAHNNICAAGDPDQSIYRWRGADIRNILAFEKDYPNAKVVKLEENFRSGASILRKADNLIAYNKNRKVKVLVPTKTEPGFVDVSGYYDETEEAQMIAEQVNDLAAKGVSLKNVAVFYRVNAMSRVIEEALFRNKIKYQIVRGVEFYRRKEIRDLLAYLKVLVNPDDEVSLLRIINTPSRGIGKVTIDKVKNYASENGISLFDALGKAGQIKVLPKGTQAKLAVLHNMFVQFQKDALGKAAPVAERVFKESGLEQMLRSEGAEGQNAIENVSELINAASKFDQSATTNGGEESNLLDFLQQISLFSDADSYDTVSDCVALMTLHAAKGLEFENVFIIGLEDGILPHERANYADDEDELEEERRLFFVGMTRAKSALYISFAKYRTIRGQTLRSIPSQFLYELDSDFEKKEQSESESQVEEYDDFEDEQDEPEEFVPGQLVRHESFGLGRVKKFVDMGANSIIQIKFNTGQTKSLMLKYANLTKVDN